MTHSPNEIAALARAYRDLLDGHTNGDHADYRAVLDARSAFTAACTPATVLALCERLAWAESRLNQLDAEHFDRLDILPCDFMNQPLTPEPEGGLPGGASGE